VAVGVGVAGVGVGACVAGVLLVGDGDDVGVLEEPHADASETATNPASTGSNARSLMALHS
jgi:hypothetical protein